MPTVISPVIPLHAYQVRIVGWGRVEAGECWWTDVGGVRHQTVAGDCQYWIAVATMGSAFGEGGAFRILFGASLVGSSAVFALVQG
jgi:hypothetical protein